MMQNSHTDLSLKISFFKSTPKNGTISIYLPDLRLTPWLPSLLWLPGDRKIEKYMRIYWVRGVMWGEIRDHRKPAWAYWIVMKLFFLLLISVSWEDSALWENHSPKMFLEQLSHAVIHKTNIMNAKLCCLIMRNILFNKLNSGTYSNKYTVLDWNVVRFGKWKCE